MIKKRIQLAQLFILSACLLIAFSLEPVQSARADGPQFMPGQEVIVMADERYIPFYISPPPPRDDISIQSVAFTVNYNSGSCSGGMASWPTQAQTAMDYALNIWSGLINGSQSIVIDACWRTDLSPGVLGTGGAVGSYLNFTGAPESNTLYPVTLANQITGSDLNSSTAEIRLSFNNSYSWYYHNSGSPGPGQYDFITVAMHEIGHGLGFSGSMKVDNGVSPDECNGTSGYGCWGYGSPTVYPLIYDHFAENGSGQSLISAFVNPSTSLASQLTSNNIYFDGVNAKTANSGSPPKLYAPASWASGSSYSHLDTTFDGTPHALMTYSTSSGEVVHHPGSVTLGILKDIGWSIYSGAPQPDLLVNSLTADRTSICVTESVTFTTLVRNGGDGSAGSSYVHYYEGSSSSDFGTYVGQDDIGALAAAGSSTETFNWAFNTTGYRYFNVQSDATNLVAESYETNNTQSIGITVNPDFNPPTGSLSINSEATYTNNQNVTLTLAATDSSGTCRSGVRQMRFSNDGSTWSSWENYTVIKVWTLAAGDGMKYVYVQYRDAAGNMSSPYYDGIILDTVAPSSSVAILPITQTTTAINLSWSGNNAYGISCYDVQVKDGEGSWSTWQSCTTSTNAIYIGSNEHTYYFRSRALDHAGNWEDYPVSPDYDTFTTVQIMNTFLPIVMK